MFDPSVKLPAGLEVSGVGRATARASGLRDAPTPAGRPPRPHRRKEALAA